MVAERQENLKTTLDEREISLSRPWLEEFELQKRAFFSFFLSSI